MNQDTPERHQIRSSIQSLIDSLPLCKNQKTGSDTRAGFCSTRSLARRPSSGLLESSSASGLTCCTCKWVVCYGQGKVGIQASALEGKGMRAQMIQNNQKIRDIMVYCIHCRAIHISMVSCRLYRIQVCEGEV